MGNFFLLLKDNLALERSMIMCVIKAYLAYNAANVS